MNTKNTSRKMSLALNLLEKDDEGKVICKKCHEHIDIKGLTKINLANMKGLGMCPSCYDEYKKSNTVSAFRQMKQAILGIPSITDQQISYLMDKEYTRQRTGIPYQLIIPFMEDKPKEKQIKKYNKARYAAQPISLNGQKYLLCNDVYLRNIPSLKCMLDDLIVV